MESSVVCGVDVDSSKEPEPALAVVNFARLRGRRGS
jgi:hypothetical protein